jgi:hypothetical protein
MRISGLLLLGLAALGPAGAAAQPIPDSRAFEPAVVTGAALAPLAGATPERVAAFRFEPSDSTWVPVPVQVDEREWLDLRWVYNGRDNARCEAGAWCFEGEAYPFFLTVYTDEGTFVGPDSDPFVDADDELVFMAQDAGAQAPADVPAPPGVRGPHGLEVRVKDPVTDQKAFVYVFWQDGRYPLDAGRPYVAYRFRLLSGDYHSTYVCQGTDFDNSQPAGYALGANPEDSEVVTAFYRRHFSDRWIEDGLALRAGGATGADLLDRWKIQYAPGDCRRTEYTGSAGRGAFVANRSGPVRAIRSVLGFNSGPYAQQDFLFYERYSLATLSLRTHAIDGTMIYTDYSAEAAGMRRYSNLDPVAFVVDGAPEDASRGELEWEVLRGAQGTLVTAYGVVSDVPHLRPTSYYADEAPAGHPQCTGDESVYGAGGPRLLDPLPNTDPGRGDAYVLQALRHQLYEAPSLPLDGADAFVDAVARPLLVHTEPYAVHVEGTPPPPPPPPGEEPDGRVILELPRPNPARDAARVTYWLAEGGEVTLAVYDTRGRRVATIDTGRREAGYHDLPLRPDRLAAGVYVLRLDTPAGSRSVTFVRE